MNEDSVYRIIEQFAKEYSQNDSMSVYHVLYGCAKLLCMEQNTLNAMFSETAEQAELRKILELFDEKDIDYTLMKNALPFVILNRTVTEQDTKEAELILKGQAEANSKEYAYGVIKSIMQESVPELVLMKKGHTLEDVIAFVDQTDGPVKAAKQQSQRTGAMKQQDEPEGGKTPRDEPSGDKTPRDEPSGDKTPENEPAEDKTPENEPAEDKTPRDESPEKMAQKEKGIEPEAGESTTATSEPVRSQGKHPAASPDEFARAKDEFQILISRTGKLYSSLLSRVKGQDEAVRVFVEGYFQAEVFRSTQEGTGKPSATFLFAGPPGVGKTFLAESAAGLLGLPFARFDMSEYTDSTSTQIFAGADPNYKSAKAGKVTSFVKENPKCVLLFDEIEKAHINIIYLFLQILDAGTLTDSYEEKQVSFKDTILIFTTNVGKALYENGRGTNLSILPRSVIMDALRSEKNAYGRERFPAAICSRFSAGNVVMFNHLGIHHLIEIVNDRFQWCAEETQKKYGYQLLIDPMVAPVLLFNQSAQLDARTASSQSVILIKNELYEFGRHVGAPDQVFQKLERIRMRVRIPEDDSETRSLLMNQSCLKILLLTDADDWRVDADQRQYELYFAKDTASASEIVKKHEIAFLVIDPACGQKNAAQQYLSMDDWESEGIRFFEQIRRTLPQMPVYLMEKHAIAQEDKATFLQRGARGFVPAQDQRVFVKELSRLCDTIYLQERANELTGRGRILTYNTAQTLSEDGKQADIIFYDFRLKMAVKAEERGSILAEDRRPKEKFGDVIGAENAKSELNYFVSFLKEPKKFALEGVKPPKGILLYGPPGTGKTMLARAMAGESNVSFFPATAAGFLNKYIGEGEKSIRDLFSMAKNYAPSIIFIDEIDAIGKERTGSTSTQHTETLLNTLLTEMDGFETDLKKPVFVLAATNYDLDGTKSGKQSAIDPALLRRFDNRILVDLPNEEERAQFLDLTLKKKNITTVSSDAVKNIAERTTGESLAILQNILALSIRNAGKQEKSLDDEILLNALEEYQFGEKREWNENYYREVSIHEAGHAYISWLSGVKPSFVTIVSRGDFGGYMQPSSTEKNPSYTKEQLLWRIRTCLAGRASEIVFFGEEEGINTGVSSDLQQATAYAMNMLCRYGMGEHSLVSLEPQMVLNSQMGPDLVQKAEAVLDREMSVTQTLIREGADKIESLSQLLLKKNQAMGTEIEEIFNR